MIAIDPGHGGTDPGAIGRGGTMEKAVTLDVARQLKAMLEATGRYRVLLTRGGDEFVSLARRAAIGPVKGAALIISLHADASTNRSARGTSVYIRSDTPTAMPEDIAGTIRPKPGSAWLQRSTIDRLDDAVRMTGAPARSDHFWVLANQQIPSVLVEMGFLSNRQDEKLLRDHRHRALLARLIRDAVNGYFAGIAQAGEVRG